MGPVGVDELAVVDRPLKVAPRRCHGNLVQRQFAIHHDGDLPALRLGQKEHVARAVALVGDHVVAFVEGREMSAFQGRGLRHRIAFVIMECAQNLVILSKETRPRLAGAQTPGRLHFVPAFALQLNPSMSRLLLPQRDELKAFGGRPCFSALLDVVNSTGEALRLEARVGDAEAWQTLLPCVPLWIPRICSVRLVSNVDGREMLLQNSWAEGGVLEVNETASRRCDT